MFNINEVSIVCCSLPCSLKDKTRVESSSQVTVSGVSSPTPTTSVQRQRRSSDKLHGDSAAFSKDRTPEQQSALGTGQQVSARQGKGGYLSSLPSLASATTTAAAELRASPISHAGKSKSVGHSAAAAAGSSSDKAGGGVDGKVGKVPSRLTAAAAAASAAGVPPRDQRSGRLSVDIGIMQHRRLAAEAALNLGISSAAESCQTTANS